jgi:hypothetical protein
MKSIQRILYGKYDVNSWRCYIRLKGSVTDTLDKYVALNTIWSDKMHRNALGPEQIKDICYELLNN